jgi:hypothetical protein
MKTKVLLILFALFALNCHKDNPIEGSYEPVALKGTVVDSTGNAISGVGVHYIFDMVAKRALDSKNTEPSTIIQFTVADSGYVMVKILRWYSRDSLDTVVDGPLNAGTHTVDISTLNLTNGVYIYQVVTTSTFAEHTFIMYDDQVSELITKTPLTTSDSQGTFSIPLGVFGINMPVVNASSDTTYISSTIQMVLHKTGYKTLTKAITIDLTKDNTKSFVLEKQD